MFVFYQLIYYYLNTVWEPSAKEMGGVAVYLDSLDGDGRVFCVRGWLRQGGPKGRAQLVGVSGRVPVVVHRLQWVGWRLELLLGNPGAFDYFIFCSLLLILFCAFQMFSSFIYILILKYLPPHGLPNDYFTVLLIWNFIDVSLSSSPNCDKYYKGKGK